jgi:hypothetical protein
MPHVGPVLEGHTFFCPHCGALYSATPSLFPRVKGMQQDVSCALKSWIDWMQPRLGALSSSTDPKMPNCLSGRYSA